MKKAIEIISYVVKAGKMDIQTGINTEVVVNVPANIKNVEAWLRRHGMYFKGKAKLLNIIN